MPMLEQKSGPGTQILLARSATPEQKKQRSLMLVALVVLLIALLLVIIKDWAFWSPAQRVAQKDFSAQVPQPLVPSIPAQAKENSRPAGTKPTVRAKPRSIPQNGPAEIAPVITSRAVLPPLEIEVVAGGAHRMVAPKNNSVNVEMRTGVPAAVPAGEVAPASPQIATNASERVRLSPNTVKAVERPVQPNYPVLAKQMKVQGAVVLQALIGKNGEIQDLHVLSGPAILSSAALEAVRQWHFKPYYLSGEPVDTQARITVNFTISTY